MEIAKEVQARLLPQAAPILKTLECAGRCLQAWRVGGDYYDFLELERGQLGLVLADVSGKGVHAALLMANLQAHLRTLSGITRSAAGTITARDLVQTLQEVNRVLWKSTAAQHYATLFFGLYDDGARSLTYVNCGHNAPMLLRVDGSVERLKSTATVVGLFEKWECEARRIDLAPGDLLAIFSDGLRRRCAARRSTAKRGSSMSCALRAGFRRSRWSPRFSRVSSSSAPASNPTT